MKDTNTIKCRRGRRIAAAASAATILPALFVANVAGAVDPTLPTDPSGGALGTMWGTIQTWTISYGVPALIGLTGLGIGIRVVTKYLKRAGRAV